MLSLAEEGIGSKWMTGALGAAPEDVMAAVGAPAGEKLMGAIWYGYPAKDLAEDAKAPPRKKGFRPAGPASTVTGVLDGFPRRASVVVVAWGFCVGMCMPIARQIAQLVIPPPVAKPGFGSSPSRGSAAFALPFCC